MEVMHPKEGWRDGRPPIPGVSLPARSALSQPALSRRAFLRRGAGTSAGLALGATGLGAALSACSGELLADTGHKTLPLARPNRPVNWPIYATTSRSRAGCCPSATRRCKVYNWVAYINEASSRVLQEVQLQVRGHHVQHDGRGAGQAQQRAAQLRCLLPDRRRDRPVRRPAS